MWNSLLLSGAVVLECLSHVVAFNLDAGVNNIEPVPADPIGDPHAVPSVLALDVHHRRPTRAVVYLPVKVRLTAADEAEGEESGTSTKHKTYQSHDSHPSVYSTKSRARTQQAPAVTY